MVKKAMFMEGQIPKGGTCISSFIIAEKNGEVLLGRMTKPEIWVERFLMGSAFAPKYASSGKWMLPASHLKFGESPDQAAQRIIRDQLRIESSSPKLEGIQSHISGDPNGIENGHWDLCIIYKTTLPDSFGVPEWFSELRYVPVKNLKPSDFTRGHGDVLEQLGLISSQ